VKYSLIACLAACACAQSSSTTYVTDINGHRVPDSSTSVAKSTTDAEKTERIRSINGREVPVEQIETRVLRDDANGKVTETITRKFDATGRLSSRERVVAEEQKRSDGGSTVHAVVSRDDVNGHFVEAERRNTETRPQGSTTTTETVIERRGVNNAFEVASKRSLVTEKTPSGENVSESEFRRSTTGQFYEAIHRVTERIKSGNQTTEESTEYQLGVTGKLELAGRTATVTSKGADGSEVSEVSLYARAAYGRVQEAGAPQQVKEQQVIQRVPGPGGEVLETVSVRRPSLADPNRLGELKKISETVCRGKCNSDN
jgi:hypothetical protein